MQFSAISCTCPSCGAPQRFSPAEGALLCEFCDTKVAIEVSNAPIEEYNFAGAVTKLEKEPSRQIAKEIRCNKCGGSFTLTPYAVSALCPYCNTPAVTSFIKEIVPKSLIPFALSQKEAQDIFVQWVSSRWFAPSSLGKHMRGQENLVGYYLPYWTYDSQTFTEYAGLRGDAYYVTVNHTVMVKGEAKQVQRQERRINWTPANGQVEIFFDDVTVGASKTLSRTILDALEPWDTSVLVNFDEKYLMGFTSEEYTVGLDNGLEYAKLKMNYRIESRIKKDIGGDEQKITSMQTHYRDITYKNILLPLWVSSFKWKEKVYHYAINAQTGKVVGERPYSVWKIVFAIMGATGCLGAWCWFDSFGCTQMVGSVVEEILGRSTH